MWGTFVGQGTGETMGAKTRLRIESEERMRGTEQPVLVHGIELQAPSIGQNLRTKQRNVVIVDDVKTCGQYLLDASRFEAGPTCLVGCQRREDPLGAFEPIHGHIRMIGIERGWFLAC